jgi:hypothetical protein
MIVWLVFFDTRAGRGQQFCGAFASNKQAQEKVSAYKKIQHADFTIVSYDVEEETPEPTL